MVCGSKLCIFYVFIPQLYETFMLIQHKNEHGKGLWTFLFVMYFAEKERKRERMNGKDY